MAADLGREADGFRLRELEDLPELEPARFELDRALPDEPFLLVDLFELPLDELLLEDCVFCAIDIASLGFPCQLRVSRRRWTCVTRLAEGSNLTTVIVRSCKCPPVFAALKL